MIDRNQVKLKSIAPLLLSVCLLPGCANLVKNAETEDAAITEETSAPAGPSEQAQAETAAQAAEVKKAEVVAETAKAVDTSVASKAPASTAPTETKQAKPVQSAVAEEATKVEKAVATTQAEAEKRVTVAPAVEPPVTAPAPIPTPPEAASTEDVAEQVVEAAPEVVEAPAPEATPEPAPEPPSADELVASLAQTSSFKPTRGGPKISASDLPVKFEVWEVTKGSSSIEKDIVITTPTWQMGEPGYNSQIRAIVMDDKVIIYSSSDFFKDSAGVKINGGSKIRFDNVINHHIGVLEGDYLERLSQGGTMEVIMGFFPDKTPASKLFTSEVALDGLADAIYHYSYLK